MVIKDPKIKQMVKFLQDRRAKIVRGGPMYSRIDPLVLYGMTQTLKYAIKEARRLDK